MRSVLIIYASIIIFFLYFIYLSEMFLYKFIELIYMYIFYNFLHFKKFFLIQISIIYIKFQFLYPILSSTRSFLFTQMWECGRPCKIYMYMYIRMIRRTS